MISYAFTEERFDLHEYSDRLGNRTPGELVGNEDADVVTGADVVLVVEDVGGDDVEVAVAEVALEEVVVAVVEVVTVESLITTVLVLLQDRILPAAVGFQ